MDVEPQDAAAKRVEAMLAFCETMRVGGGQRSRRRPRSQHIGKHTDICFENQHANTREALDGGCKTGDSFSVLSVVRLDLIDN